MSDNLNDIFEEDKLKKSYDGKLMLRLIKYAKNYWKHFAASLILLTFSTIPELARPYLIKIVIDDYLSTYSNGPANTANITSDLNAVGIIALIYMLLIVVGFAANYFHTYILSHAGQSIIFNIRQQLFSHMQKLSVSFFDKNPIGRLVTRITNDTETLNEMYTNVLITLFKDIIILLGSIIIMFSMNIKLSLIVLAFMPVIVLLTLVFRVKAREIYRKVRESLAKLNSTLSENISGMKIVQIFNREKENYKKFKKINHAYYKAEFRQIIVFGIFRPSMELIAGLTVAVLLWYGGIRVLDGALTFGVLYALVNYVGQFFKPINDLSEKFNIMQSSMASSERIFLILDTDPELDDGTINLNRDDFDGEIEFKNVWFSYTQKDWILKDFSFKLEAGKSLAIVGATGSGKTTIINLLCRFYEIQKGEILINGINIKNIMKSCLRANIGMVLQDVFLFSDTINENIRLNNEIISDDTIRTTSKNVNAHQFIMDLPKKYNEIVSERGSTFSTGQRQLLAFARALAYDPSVLILDEATANIDTETEGLIQNALLKLTKNRTTIIIAHRLSTIKHTDNIIMLHNGKIIEQGTHKELLNKKSMYYNLYNLQFNEM